MEFLPIWDVRVTIDLFLGGIGIGAFLWSVLASFQNREGNTAIVRIGGFIAPVAVGLGLLVLMTKLGRPQNIFAVTGLNPESMMSIGMYLQGIFVLIALAYVWRLIKNPQFDTSMRAIQHTGVVMAMAVGLYHGLLLSGLERVLWTDLVPVTFFVSSMVTGLAAILLIKAIFTRGDEERTGFLGFAIGLLATQLLVVLVWQYMAVRSGLEAELSYTFLMSQFGGLWWLAIVGGVVIPAVLMALPLLTRGRYAGRGLMVAASVLILAGSFGLKHLFILGGQIAVPLEVLNIF
jgi:protein NrfD